MSSDVVMTCANCQQRLESYSAEGRVFPIPCPNCYPGQNWQATINKINAAVDGINARTDILFAAMKQLQEDIQFYTQALVIEADKLGLNPKKGG